MAALVAIQRGGAGSDTNTTGGVSSNASQSEIVSGDTVSCSAFRTGGGAPGDASSNGGTVDISVVVAGGGGAAC